MEYSHVETLSNDHKKNAKISIRPFVPEDDANMGLRGYDMVVFEGIVHEEPLACIEHHGVKRYINGLNEFAPELKDLSDDERIARIKYIRKTVAQLEKEFRGNIIKEDDEDFWNKVQLLRPDNSEFWEKLIIRIGNDPVFLMPMKDNIDLLKVIAIENGGFSIVAPSLSVARTSGNKYKFYLDKYAETASIKTEIKKLRNKALALLQDLFDENQTKLLYVSKIIDGNSAQYVKSMPHDVMYDNMDKFINGELFERDKRRTAKAFLAAASLDMDTLKIRAIIKDAHFHRVISTRSDGGIYHNSTNTLMGKNPAEVLQYLKVTQ